VFVAALAALAGLALPATAGEPDSTAAIAALVKQLDNDAFAIRERAYQKLLEIGLPALPQLQGAVNSPSFEQRHRARALVGGIQGQVLRAAFKELARQDDEQLDLEQGMWLMSRLLDPAVRRDDLTRQLDELADKVRKELGKDVTARSADPRKVVAALQQVLFVKEKFTGNRDDYNNPQNSSLSHVLATRKGLPVLLSQVVVSVAQRVRAPIVGLGLPGRFMIKYDGSQAPEGFAKDDIVLDPFGNGKIVTNDELATMIPGFDPDSSLEPYGRRETLIRMLRNLISDLSQAKQTAQADLAREFLDLVQANGNGDDPFR
jgi:regulator of sirC expression with transglutaminase-like and TPR domain